MNTKSLTGIVVGLMIATSMLYFYLAIDNFQEDEPVEASFFLAVAMIHLPVCAWMITKESKIPHVIALTGTIAVIVLYAITRTDMALALGLEAGGFGGMGIISKVFQVGIVVGTIMMLFQLRSKSWIKQQA